MALVKILWNCSIKFWIKFSEFFTGRSSQSDHMGTESAHWDLSTQVESKAVSRPEESGHDEHVGRTYLNLPEIKGSSNHRSCMTKPHSALSWNLNKKIEIKDKKYFKKNHEYLKSNGWGSCWTTVKLKLDSEKSI